MKYSLPFIMILILLGILGKELFDHKPLELPSTLIGEPLPHFKLPNLYTSQPDFNNEMLKGQVSLLNFWASWCEACRLEHSMLMKIKEKYPIPIYSINYKDEPNKALTILTKDGNPYKSIGFDANGDVGIDFGIYGTPETFLIDAQGKIIYRHIGPITQKDWDELLWPMIRTRLA